MGISQINFYHKKNDLNSFPDVHQQKPNKSNKNDNWIFYSIQPSHNHNYLINNNKVELQYIYDFEYKRPEEKLKKGQNQLIFEKLQQKYISQLKDKTLNINRTRTGFYKNNKNSFKGRQRSALDNANNIVKGIISDKELLDKSCKEKKNINLVSQKVSIDAGKMENISTKEKMFNKTFNNGFIVKKKDKEIRKKQKLILTKIVDYFGKKLNYFWVKYYNRKRKNKYKEKEEEENIKKNKSFDNYHNLLYPIIIKKNMKINLINNKRYYYKKKEIKFNTENSEKDEIKEYKKYQNKQKKKEYDFSFMKNNKDKNKDNYKEEDKKEYSDNSNSNRSNRKEPEFRSIFDKNDIKNPNNKNINNNFQYKTTSEFFTSKNEEKNGKKNDEKKNEEEGQKCKEEFDKKKKRDNNIENIINNVIENNKRAAAARSSTSFYNIGSHFMNNHMRSTKTKFYNPKDKKGAGTFTGTKDSNFTKEQANEGKFNKPNSLKLTLINPINWRKHEEIWDNLVSLNMGLAELERYLLPPNETDVLVSSYLKMNPRVLNFCSLQKINTSNTKNENNFISFMVDDNIQNPKQEIKKWKEAYKRVIFRWHPDKLFSILEDIKFKNEQQKIELKKKSSLIINNTNTLYKNLMEILNKILLAKDFKDNNI